MDYNKISNSANPTPAQQTTTFVNEDVVQGEQATQATNEPQKPELKYVDGTVFNCKRLNIRKKPDKESEVLMVVDAGTFLMIIEPEKAKGDWYKVVAEIDEVETTGFCMKEFVTLDE
jgi:uncharacterized protein YgiM (DUF1202 family)